MTKLDLNKLETIECLCDWAEQFHQTVIDKLEYMRRLRTLGMNATEIEEEIRRNSQ